MSIFGPDQVLLSKNLFSFRTWLQTEILNKEFWGWGGWGQELTRRTFRFFYFIFYIWGGVWVAREVVSVEHTEGRYH